MEGWGGRTGSFKVKVVCVCLYMRVFVHTCVQVAATSEHKIKTINCTQTNVSTTYIICSDIDQTLL